jgi:hypothetical protein
MLKITKMIKKNRYEDLCGQKASEAQLATAPDLWALGAGFGHFQCGADLTCSLISDLILAPRANLHR